ncbi:hypothetical protein GUJ93_ZPchr0013g36807 [Zizania palustris]|uniref:Uncharacterized protein n=1 Tax=Zizania palustris TaxID=103762 RepID=A0A8J5WUV9_ZIZPA|nr:hypothetical protein GUJ93_ZPchr0013g36807 [Zizania palustris]
MGSSPASSYDCSFKILLIGDSAVGKSSLLVSFVSASHIDDDMAPTIGVDFKIKFLTVNGKKLKLTIWDTGGQCRRLPPPLDQDLLNALNDASTDSVVRFWSNGAVNDRWKRWRCLQRWAVEFLQETHVKYVV